MPELATKQTCSGCMACKDKCPKEAITSVIGEDGHRYIKIDSNRCVECKICEKTCPVVNGFSYGKNNLQSNFYAGWSDNSSIRDKGATSGIFGAIADSFIRNGGFVAGAVMDGLECRYILINSLDDIERLQGSKYTSSDPSGIYKVILDKLRSGKKVLFSGLPCHVAALLNFIPLKLQTKLYTIDLICGGVSSPKLIERFVSEKSDITSILSFRNKKNGWKPNGYRYSLTYLTKNGQIHSEPNYVRNLVTDGFACELTDRYSCYDCHFNGCHRKSDVTIGDLWKDKLFVAEHFRGVSSIIVHSEKGHTLIESSSITLKKIDPENILYPNHRIFNGKSIKAYFPERRLIGRIFKWLNYESLVRIYAGDLKTWNILWWPMAAYRVISFRIANIFQRESSKRILNKLFK